MTGVRRVGATPIAPTDDVDYTPHGRRLLSLGNPVFMEVDPRGPEFVYQEPFLDDDMPPTVLPVDDDTLFLVYMHENDVVTSDFTTYESVYIRKLVYDAALPVRASVLELPGGGGSAAASHASGLPRGARFDGETGSYAGADVDFTYPFGTPDDLDIRMQILPDDWTPTADQILIEKWVIGDACFRLTLKTNGHLFFEKAADDGTTIDSAECSVAVDYTLGQPKWVRVTSFSGTFRFWEVDDPEFLSWAQVGDTEFASFSALNMSSAAPVLVGAGSGADLVTPLSTTSEFTGTIYESQVWMESNLYFDPLFSSATGGWTPGDSDGDSIEVTNRAGTDTLTLHGGAEIRSALDLTDLIDLRLSSVTAADWTPASRTVLVGDDNWEFSVEPSGLLRLAIAQDGATPTMLSASSSTATAFGSGTSHNLRVTWNVASGIVKFYTSDPGAPTWVQLGTNQSITVTGIFESTGSLRVGSGCAGANPFTGTIERMDLYLDLTRAAAPVFVDQPPGAAAFTDGLGVNWTFTGDASVVDVAGSTTEGFEVSDEVVLWGGLTGADAIPPLPGGRWDVSRGYVQAIPVDTDHVIVRFYDEDGDMDNEDIGTGDYKRSTGCSLVEIDWDAKTVSWGPWNIIFQDGAFAYEYSYGDVGLTIRRLAFLPDGRFVAATTTWDWMGPALIVGTMDYDTGVVTFGDLWTHPDEATDSNWTEIFSGIQLFVIDDTRVALFWKNYEDFTLPDYPVNVAIFDVENDDSMTLVDWANVTMADAPAYGGEVYIDDPTYNVTFEQVRPGIFVGVFYNELDSYLEMVSVNLADLTDNALEWSHLYGPEDELNPVLYRSPALWNIEDGYPEYHRIAVTNIVEGQFVMTWQDYTRAIPRTGLGAEFDVTTVEIARAFVMADDMTFQTTSAVLQASTSDIGENFETRERYQGGMSGALSAHGLICTAALFEHSANWWADPAPDPDRYNFGVLMVMRNET